MSVRPWLWPSVPSRDYYNSLKMVIYSGLHRCDGALRSMCEHITMLVSPAPCTAQRNSVQYYAAPPSSLSSANINLACISVQAQIEEGKQQNVKSMNLLGADHILPTLACLCHALSSHAAMPRRLRQFWCCNFTASSRSNRIISASEVD